MIRILILGFTSAVILFSTSCDRALSNVQTMVTDDCGQTWKLIKPGEAIPKGVGMCHYKITIPDYPMQGECAFKATFKDRVRANIEMSYDYSITDAALFISEAKYLGKVNTNADDAAMDRAFETAENSVIDKRIKDVIRDLLPAEDIVDFSQADFEERLMVKVNEALKSRGVRINFLSFVPTPDVQTRQAIDVATAMKIYDSKGLHEEGKLIIAAKAGATTVVTNVVSGLEKAKE